MNALLHNSEEIINPLHQQRCTGNNPAPYSSLGPLQGTGAPLALAFPWLGPWRSLNWSVATCALSPKRPHL